MMGILGLLALGAFGTYYHFGMPQFFDQAKGRRTLVHTWDMRHYFPWPSTFPELRFDGLYLASLAAYIDNTPASRRRACRACTCATCATPRCAAGRVAEPVPGSGALFARALGRVQARHEVLLAHHGRRRLPRQHAGPRRQRHAGVDPAGLLHLHVRAGQRAVISLAGLIDPMLVLFLFFVVWRTFGCA